MHIKFTDDCPSRLSRGPSKGVLFTKPGQTYEVPEILGKQEEACLAHWLDAGWAKEAKKKKIRKGAEGTGPVAKSEVDAPEGTPEE